MKIYYNLSPDECAAECLKSASVCPNNVRCLSFDYYPFEAPVTTEPWSESYATGVCVLNDQNKDSARLRNSDLGYSDANLYYRTHFSYMPFVDTEGYYELRDPRGSQSLSYMLNYGMYDANLPATVNVWGGSRWGIYHYSVPEPVTFVTSCPPLSGASGGDYALPRYYGGYTPVNNYQHCPGAVTFAEAEELCATTGGRLCTSYELELLHGVKLGCGFDGPVRGKQNLVEYGIWASEDGARPSGLKYPRCCATYANLDSCAAYKWNGEYCAPGSEHPYCAYTQCSRYTTATDCVNFASGTAAQITGGEGVFLSQIRADCQRSPTTQCKGMVQDWRPRDQCVWCPTQGLNAGGGAGECRVGSSLAICKNTPQLLRMVWANIVRTHTGCQPYQETVCRLAQAYPDLYDDLVDPAGNYTRTPTLSQLPAPFCVVEPGETGMPTAQPNAPPTQPTVGGLSTAAPTYGPATGKSSPTHQPVSSAGDAGSHSPTPKGGAQCYMYQNVPTQCNSVSGCAYDTKTHECVQVKK